MQRPGVIALLSIGVASPAAAQYDSTAGRTVVVDSISPRAPARSLSELLTARFPGVLVWSSSGTVGTSSRILMRGPNTIFGNGAPLVLVDGMVVDANPASFLPFLGGQQVARLDDLDPADIASVQVLDGASDAAPFGTGAGSGVLVITTKQGEIGPPRVRFSSTQGSSSDPHTFPPSFTPGPGGIPQVNPLEAPATSPFRSGYLRDYRGEISGGWAPATYYLSTHWEGVGGVYGLPATEQSRLAAAGTLHPENLNPNNLSRLTVRAAGTLRIARQADITVTGGLLSSSLRLPINDNSVLGILGNGEVAAPGSASPWAFFPPGDLFQIVNTDDVHRMIGTVKAEWRPFGWLWLDALAGHESVRQADRELQRNGEGPAFGTQRQGLVEQDTVREVNTTYRITARARASLTSGITLTTLAGLETRWIDLHTFQGIGRTLPPGSTSFEDAVTQSVTVGFFGQTTAGVLFNEQAAIGGRWTADIGARVDRLKAAGLQEPSTTYPHAALSFLAVRSPLSSLQSVRLRVSWARVGNYGGAPIAADPEITSEVEGGVEATAASGALHVSVTGYERHSHVDKAVSSPGGPLPLVGTIENTGLVLTTALQVLRSSRIDWQAQFGVWGNRNRTVGFPALLNIGSQLIKNGYPIASYFSRRIVGYSDANGDGMLEAGEVQLSTVAGFVGTPFPTQGATLGTTVRWGRLHAALLMEYRAGNQMLDAGEELRCLQQVCSGVNTNASPADQAAAAVAGNVTAPFVSDGAFLKVRELAVSIAAPDAWVRWLHCRAATLTLAGRNLLTWTSYRGLDPEVSSTGAVGVGVIDLFTQPPVRTLAVRLDLAL